jgi:hypothetical protein
MKKLLFVATLLVTATAANAVEIGGARAAAIKDCNAESKRHPPGKYYDWDGGWAVMYGACMHRHGEAP